MPDATPRSAATALPAPAPTPTPETAAFWAATAEGRLLLARCTACAAVVWYPRARCPVCHAGETAWFEAAGTGTVYSATVSRRGEGAYAEAAPYVLAYVELDEGPRLLTNIVDVPVDEVRIGQRVMVTFADTGTGAALVRFRPVPAATAGPVAPPGAEPGQP
jgi:uncharacterized OB-fold protein